LIAVAQAAADQGQRIPVAPGCAHRQGLLALAATRLELALQLGQ
jgi:hypothetical protein